MYRNDNDYEEKSQHNPWISFSDLFCGLLLVFILLFFFAIYRYVGAKEANDADTLKLKLEMISEQEQVLALYKADAEDLEAAVLAQSEELAAQKEAYELQSQELEDQRALITLTQSDLDDRQTLLEEKESELGLSRAGLEAKEIELNASRSQLAGKESELAVSQAELASQESELEVSKLTISEQEKLLNAQKALLEEQSLKLEEIVGVRKALITELNDRMVAEKIQVQADQTTGAIAFQSEILYEFDRSELKQEGKDFFRTFMPVYMNVLLQPEFRDYIGEVIIEGHTDQKGEYFHNLQLSQQRAYSVADYILRNEGAFLKEDVLEELRSMITVNGCADRNLIYNADGTINEDKSRRVEIKFRLKDQEMIDELDEILSSQ